ncbi:MAG: hypothetical protein HOV86_08070, partial [Thermoactinospora sp.]|nr:hypothetical protein [Thermoactinospora sp.]
IVVLAALALATDQDSLLWTVVTQDSGLGRFRRHAGFALPWWLTLLLVPVGLLQAWALWQVLRGRSRAELTERGRMVGLLRLFLYLSVGQALFVNACAPLINTWELYWLWTVVILFAGCVQLALAWLYFQVLRATASRGLRSFSVTVGTLGAVSVLGSEIAALLGLEAPTVVFSLAGGYGHMTTAWTVSILVAQARDPRWSAATVRIGVIALVMSILRPGAGLTVSMSSGFPGVMTVHTLIGAVMVFGLVWEARSAHDLAHPLLPREPVRVPARHAARWWPVAAVAVALPLLPAAVNLADGRYHWTGPRGVIESFFREVGDATAWLAVDVFVGVGGPALLVLLAVLRRSHTVVRFTTVTLMLVAAVGFVNAFTAVPLPADFGELYEGAQLYPKEMFSRVEGGQIDLGLSPAWYAAALLASALLLRLLYPAPLGRTAPRTRGRVLVASGAAVLALSFVPAADQAIGRITPDEDCRPRDPWMPAPDLAGDKRLVCSLRQADRLEIGPGVPDAVVLAQARHLCTLYTRNDPQQLARLREAEGLTRESLTGPLAEICPAAGAVVSAATAEEDREMQAWQDDAQRMCDSTPRHRPLITPAEATRVKEPQSTDHGVLEVSEPTDDAQDPFEDGVLDRAQDNGLAASVPGHLMVLSHSDSYLCVTVETYTRRPPVETKGWEHVVEVGYQSPTGSIVLRDPMIGTELPDLSLRGRPGHYRIRVHFAWFDWKGEQGGGQRLLIMAYPGKDDRTVTYRKPGRR